MENRLADLQSMIQRLDMCQKSLNEYLDMKKKIYPRFYFVSNVRHRQRERAFAYRYIYTERGMIYTERGMTYALIVRGKEVTPVLASLSLS